MVKPYTYIHIKRTKLCLKLDSYFFTPWSTPRANVAPHRARLTTEDRRCFVVSPRLMTSQFKDNITHKQKIYDSKIHILRCMGPQFCVKFQRCSLKFHTKFWTHCNCPSKFKSTSLTQAAQLFSIGAHRRVRVRVRVRVTLDSYFVCAYTRVCTRIRAHTLNRSLLPTYSSARVCTRVCPRTYAEEFNLVELSRPALIFHPIKCVCEGHAQPTVIAYMYRGDCWNDWTAHG